MLTTLNMVAAPIKPLLLEVLLSTFVSLFSFKFCAAVFFDEPLVANCFLDLLEEVVVTRDA